MLCCSGGFLKNYDEEKVTLKGISLLRFLLERSQLQNETENPNNTAYYAIGPSGTINIANCEQNVPVRRARQRRYGC